MTALVQPGQTVLTGRLRASLDADLAESSCQLEKRLQHNTKGGMARWVCDGM